MAYYIDLKYLSLVSSYLPQYTVTSSNPFKASCRCYICGDSKKNAYKKRFHLYQHKDTILGKCFNCGAARGIKSILKELNPELRKEYDLETFADARPVNIAAAPVIHHKYLSDGEYNKYLKNVKKISQLSVGHPARAYVESRNIPSSQHFRLYYVPKFFAWTNSIIPDKFRLDNGDEPRLLIPFFDKEGNMFGYQGRSFDPSNDLRYITIMMRGNFTKVFGLDQWDKTKTTYVLEGCLDSLFVKNGLAVGQGDLSVALKFVDKDKTVFIPDKDTRNREVMKNVKKLIDMDCNVCMLPETFADKDINGAAIKGLTEKNISDIIKFNTYRGPMARLRFNSWQKVGDLI